jgi:hypothetical protein
MASTQRDTVARFFQTFEALNCDAHVALRSPRCHHRLIPALLNMPAMTNEHWYANFTSMKPIIASFPTTIKEMFENGGNHVTAWVGARVEFEDEARDEREGVDWNHDGEFMFVFTLNGTRDKIDCILEFLDVGTAVPLQGLM